MRLVPSLVALLLALFAARPARACAVCGAADPTLPVSGAETPFKGRIRITTDARVAAFRAIEAGPSGPLTLDERRLDLVPSWAPRDDLLLTATVPLVWRTIGAIDQVSLGDVEVRATVTLWRSKPAAVRQRFAVTVGLKGPTAPLQRDTTGRALPTDLQPGCGSIVPIVGAYWSIARGPWSLVASAGVLLPTPVRDGPHPGASFRAGATGQFQPSKWFGLRLGALARGDTAGAIGDKSDPFSGGGAVYLVPEIIVSPTTDVVLSLGASFPAVQAWRGYRALGPVALATVSYDF